ncbi:MAG: Fe-S cluster assembly protein SufD [Thermoanaerobaculia bacterium]|nr:Fe-S cluster assembly protein SufD [Thermoanaerobaculia bacterium]
MPAVAEEHSLLTDYGDFESSLPQQPEAVADLRRRGVARFEELGFPSTRQEEWRFTNVAPVAKTSYVRAGGRLHGLTAAKLEPFQIPGTVDLVFVNGRYSEELSRQEEFPSGVFAGSLAAAMAWNPDLVSAHLGRYAGLDHPFVALNSAHVEDGAFVYVPRGVKLEQTLHLLFVATAGDQATVSYPRNLIVVDESAEATVVESYCGYQGDVYFTCPVTEIVGGANSVVDHYRLGEESLDAFHLGTLKIHLERDANFFTHSVNHGGAIVRNDIQAYLGGEGIHCTLNGLYLGRKKQLVDHHMWVDHAKPHCHSYELFKGILEDQSRAVFNGRIKVHEDAQKTDAKQSSQHLLLSDKALAQSNPQLEIFADDVRCTHGSTTGQIDEEALFYLRSRGIGEEAAKSLLTYAFAVEVLQEFRLETVRKDLEEFLFTRLPKGDVVRQAV